MNPGEGAVLESGSHLGKRIRALGAEQPAFPASEKGFNVSLRQESLEIFGKRVTKGIGPLAVAEPGRVYPGG